MSFGRNTMDSMSSYNDVNLFGHNTITSNTLKKSKADVESTKESKMIEEFSTEFEE